MSDVNTKVSVEGAAQYKAKMGELASAAKRLDSEMAALTSGFDKNTSAQEKNQAKQELMGRMIENQQAIVDTLTGKYNEMTAELDRLAAAADQAKNDFGENSNEAKKAELEYTRYQTATNKVAAELNNAQAALNNMKNGLQTAGDEAEKAEKKVSVFGDVLKAKLTGDFIENAAKGVASAVTGTAKAIFNLAIDSAAYADEISTLASTTGMSTDALQEYKYMAELTDVSLQTITASQTKLIKAMASAKDGGKAASEAFKNLKVSALDGNGALRDVETVWLETLTALAEIPNETERDAAAMELFGKRARELNPLIEAGADALEAYRKEAHEVGYVLNQEQLTALNKVDDGWQSLQKRFEGFKNQLGASMAPAAEAVFDALEKIVSEIDWQGLSDWVSGISENFADWLNNVDFSEVISQFAEGADAAITFFENVNKVFELFNRNKGAGSAVLNAMTASDINTAGFEAVADFAISLAEVEKVAEAPALTSLPDKLSALPDTFGALSGSFGAIPKNADSATSALDSFAASASDTSEAMGTEFVDAMAAAGTAASQAASQPIEDAGAQLAELSQQASTWGRDMMVLYAQGIDQYADVAIAAADRAAQGMKDRLGFSVPKKGPLSNADTYMPDFMDLLAKGINDNAWMPAKAAENAANAIAAGILLNRQSAEAAVAAPAADYSEIIAAINEAGASSRTELVLEGDIGRIFRAVRRENNRVYGATGYNQLGRR